MGKKLVLGLLVFGVMLVGVLGVMVLLTEPSLMAEEQVPSLQVDLPTDTLVQPVKTDQPTPCPSATDTDEPFKGEPIIELIGSTEVVIPTDTFVPARKLNTYTSTPTDPPKPPPLGKHPDVLIGEYYCYGHEGGLLAFWGRVILNKDGSVETYGYYKEPNHGKWRYDDLNNRIVFGPDTFFFNFGEIHSFANMNIGITFHSWAVKTPPAHAELGRIGCEPPYKP